MGHDTASSPTGAATPADDNGTPHRSAFAAALHEARRAALRGGIPAIVAMLVQVVTLMWLRTAVNYQHRHGGNRGLWATVLLLYNEGGLGRLYSGVGFALIQAALARFGDTAANAGALALLNGLAVTRHAPVMVKTALASTCAALWRIAIMPVDTMKTSLQVDGSRGLQVLQQRLATEGVTCLFSGAAAASLATFVGHYPFFVTYNILSLWIPVVAERGPIVLKLLRSAAIGWCATLTSDVLSNPVRVVKTVKQTSADGLGYMEVVQRIVAEEGWVQGLFLRGLESKLVANAIQGMMFMVMWRLLEEWMKQRREERAQRSAAAAAAKRK